ncbi:MAG: hypothetical protein JWO78_620 [Micavibrio sp.]|nr:hypothetical protein [Micavibrio sp.]
MKKEDLDTTENLDIKEYLYYPDVDAFLIRGFRPGLGQNLPRAIVGWLRRSNPAGLIDAQSFFDIPSSMRSYKAIQESGDFPEELFAAKDLQQRSVYAWEDKMLIPDFDAPIATLATAQKIARKVSRDLDIPCPKIIWVDTADENEDGSTYDSDSHTIEFRHRSLLALLHELAHAVHSKKTHDENNQVHHSPGFVWQAINLYNRYAGIDLDYLVQSAAIAEILGPVRIQGPAHYIRAIMPKPHTPG